MSTRYGSVLTDERVSRGLAVGDLDDDGRLDVVINDQDGSPQVLRNELADAGHWLRVRLVGKGGNTNAIGAVAVVSAAGGTERRLVQSGTGYLSQDDARLHFGLGPATRVDTLVVTWPDGTTTRRENVAGDQTITIEQTR